MYSYHDIGKGINIWTILVVFQLATQVYIAVILSFFNIQWETKIKWSYVNLCW